MPLRTIGLQHPPNGACFQPGLTLRDFAQTFDQHFWLDLARNDGMRAAPEQFQRHLLIRFLQHNHQAAVSRILPEDVRNRVGGFGA
jgi:hypothetical protein